MYKVYRIEKVNTLNAKDIHLTTSPYRFNGDFTFLDELHKKHRESGKHPSYYLDFKFYYDLCNSRDYYFACQTKELLKKWFYGFMNKLKKDKFYIYEYTVSNLIIGESNKQCIFNINDIIDKKIIK